MRAAVGTAVRAAVSENTARNNESQLVCVTCDAAPRATFCLARDMAATSPSLIRADFTPQKLFPQMSSFVEN